MCCLPGGLYLGLYHRPPAKPFNKSPSYLSYTDYTYIHGHFCSVHIPIVIFNTNDPRSKGRPRAKTGIQRLYSEHLYNWSTTFNIYCFVFFLNAIIAVYCCGNDTTRFHGLVGIINKKEKSKKIWFDRVSNPHQLFSSLSILYNTCIYIFYFLSISLKF